MKKIILLTVLLFGLITLQAQTRVCNCGRDYDIFDSLLGLPKKELLDSLAKAGACFESDYSEVRIVYGKGNIKINYEYNIATRLEFDNPNFTYEDIKHVFLEGYYLTKDKSVFKFHNLRDKNFHFYLTWETYIR